MQEFEILLVIENGTGGVHEDMTLCKTGVVGCSRRACQRLVVSKELLELVVINA